MSRQKSIIIKYFVPLLIFCLGTVLSLYSVERHDRIMTSTFDLGIFDQALYLTAHGESLFLNTRGLHVQGDHFHPILFFLAPAYLFFSSSKVLLIIQAYVIALGIYPIYHLARRYELSKGLATLLSLSYVMHPTVSYLYTFDFHPVSILTTAFLFAVYYLEVGSQIGYLISIVFAASCTESAGFTIVALAATAFLVRNFRWAIVTFFIGLGAMVTSKLWLRYFNDGSPAPYSALFTEYGENELDIVKYLLYHPIDALEKLAHWEYLYFLFIPLFFLPLLSPERLLPALPTFFGNLLSWRESQHTIFFHYGAAIAPFLLWATVAGCSRLRAYKVSEVWLAMPLFLGVWASVTNGPWQYHLPLFREKELYHIRHFDEIVQSNDSVSSESPLGGHLSDRKDLYLFPNPYVTIAWGNTPQSLIEQSSGEHTPISYGEFRRGMESQDVDFVIFSRRTWRSSFPLSEAETDFCRGQLLRSPYYEVESADDISLILRRVNENS